MHINGIFSISMHKVFSIGMDTPPRDAGIPAKGKRIPRIHVRHHVCAGNMDVYFVCAGCDEGPRDG